MKIGDGRGGKNMGEKSIDDGCIGSGDSSSWVSRRSRFIDTSWVQCG